MIFYLVDHLGSIRVVLNESGGVDSWSDYYPLGKEARLLKTQKAS